MNSSPEDISEYLTSKPPVSVSSSTPEENINLWEEWLAQVAYQPSLREAGEEEYLRRWRVRICESQNRNDAVDYSKTYLAGGTVGNESERTAGMSSEECTLQRVWFLFKETHF